MIDVESWNGEITGNQSDGLNNAYRAIADWLGDRRRVITYGNRGDLNILWPYKPDDLRIVLATMDRIRTIPAKLPTSTQMERDTAAAYRRGVRHSASVAWTPLMGALRNGSRRPAVSVWQWRPNV